MRRVDKRRAGLVLRSTLALLCSVWLWVFLDPMQKLGLVDHASSFLPVFLILYIAQLFPYRMVRLLGDIIVSVGYVIHYYSLPGLGFAGNFHHLWQLEARQVTEVADGGSLVDPLQTQLFLGALCIMYWLIVYASRRSRLWIFYNLLAVVVLGIVDGNTPVHPDFAIVSVLFVWVVVMGIMHFVQLQGNLDERESASVRFFVPLSGLVAVSLAVGWVFPKQPAAWPNPMQAVNSLGKGHGSTVQVSGYQSDNTHLGGTFVMNHDPVLSVVTQYPTYLRGQVYDIYTGHGWMPESSVTQLYDVGEPFGGYVPKVRRITTHPVDQTVTVLSDQLHASCLFGAYQVDQIQQMSGLGGQSTIQVDGQTGIVTTAPLVRDETYQVVSYELQDPYSLLSTLPAWPSDAAGSLPPDTRNDLQLPADVPVRIRNLAQEITSHARNEYDMVTEIRDYLQAHYPYDTENVPVPGDRQDYVDQFLFESKKGYCNNFSSAMAVMLRTLGIPTRWVTGFATGQLDGTYSGPDARYIYQNADAHSWVEVYFPQTGWVPFDPTPNFYMPYLSAAASTNPAGSITPATKPVTHPKDPTEDPQSSSASGGGAGQIHWGAILHGLEWFFGIVLALAMVLGYVFRRQIREMRHRLVWKQNTVGVMQRALQHLVRLMRRYGDIPDKPSTLRDLHPIAKSYGISDEEYAHLIHTAEANWYGSITPAPDDVEKVRHTWVQWLLGVLRR